jgi:hypothetical protein
VSIALLSVDVLNSYARLRIRMLAKAGVPRAGWGEWTVTAGKLEQAIAK